MKKVAILTTFIGYLESYSLCSVVRTQLRMFTKAGYEPRFIYRGGGGWEGMASDIKLIPDYIVDNDGNSTGMEKRSGKTFNELVMDTLADLENVLAGFDVVVTHDLIFQPSNNIQDAAASLYAQKHPEVLFLHWIHSATSPAHLGKQIGSRYPNFLLVYPNSWDVPRVARNFGVEEVNVTVVPHPLDYVDYFKMHPLTERLMDEKGIMDADVLCCYPLRLDRGKQPEFCIEILAEAKRYWGRTIRLVIIDFQSTGGDKVVYRNELKQLAVKLGLSSDDVTFMSEFDKSCELQTPKEVVRDLFQLSNVYIHPSRSETYSLTSQEARACGNMLMLNLDFPAMMSIYGEGPIYRNFGSCVDALNRRDGSTNVAYGDRVTWMRDAAGNILYHLERHQSVLWMKTETRKTKNPMAVFKKFIEPLFYRTVVERKIH